jgi:nitrogen regulatory protein PII
MHTVTRLEIMADSVELHKIMNALDKAGNVTYTVLKNVSSHGVRGESGYDSNIASENNYIIAFCPPESAKSLLEVIRPILNKFGGACFTSEATQVKSLRCVAEMTPKT